jgi:hypothetical protein
MSKWFCNTSTGAAQEQPAVVLLWGRLLASWLLALGEHGGHGDLRGSGRLSVIPYVHGRNELYCAQACLARAFPFFDPSEVASTRAFYSSRSGSLQ